MRDVDDPALLDYLRAENAAADRFFAPHAGTIETIFGEIRSRVQETDMSTPVEFGPWWYVTSTTEGMNYPAHHRGPTAERATEIVLLDENIEADGHEFFELGAFDVSMDHRVVAWSKDVTGDEHYTLHFRDLTTGVDLDDRIDDTSNAGIAWSRDGQWVFYVTPDEQERPATVWRHRLGTARTDDVCVFDETDERFFVAIGSTRSDGWIVIHSASRTSADVRIVSTDRPTDEPVVIMERRDDVEYNIDHWGDSFVMHTNDEAVDFRLLIADADADTTDPAAWSELVAHQPGRRIVAERRAPDRPGDAHHRRGRLSQRRVGHQALEDVGHAFGIADQDQTLVRCQIQSRNGIPDLARVLRTARKAVHGDVTGSVTNFLQMSPGERKGLCQAGEALPEKARHESDMKLQARGPQENRAPGGCPLVPETLQDLPAGAVIGKAFAGRFVQRAENLPETPARVFDALRAAIDKGQRRPVETQGRCRRRGTSGERQKDQWQVGA
jgi:hypothetical protein